MKQIEYIESCLADSDGDGGDYLMDYMNTHWPKIKRILLAAKEAEFYISSTTTQPEFIELREAVKGMEA